MAGLFAWLRDVVTRRFTIGHALAAAASMALIYFAWGRFFTPGGTGSNVVLGLLVALAFVYLVSTNTGPNIDDAIAGKQGAKRRRVRETRDMLLEVDGALKRARAGSLKGASKAVLDAGQVETIAQARGAFAQALTDYAAPSAGPGAAAHLDTTLAALEAVLQKELGDQTPTVFAQLRGLAGAFAVAVVLRLWLVAPFQIPSASMIPTLLIGDHLFVFRASYGLQLPSRFQASNSGSGWSKALATVTQLLPDMPVYLARWSLPTPGDVVVFEAPPWVGLNSGEDWIKRVIARPGQRVRRVGLTVFVDDKPYTLEGGDDGGTLTAYKDFSENATGGGTWVDRVATLHTEGIPNRRHATFANVPPTTLDWPDADGRMPIASMRGLSCDSHECKVNDGFVFVMGDNRDNSMDGRTWGAVPIDSVKGRAWFIWVSVDGSSDSVHLGRFSLPRFRWDRLFQWIA